ncbi:nucleotidyltransferase domain-containing protein [Lachnotalea sp. AF33-28]|uniref:nucleotidyltransferase domain-containing protein n=1 Tax=Lachnotalea sp. AF33-28 TaxID=2292046 RepID=UPI000E4EBBB4|nr:nucleotidyltransferase domain-containing protein [Lachnotalea sp. AF33-28]RHP34579.1 nucleotidyltransferase domain-containing protein [Lachnotalea sp. AF33-28]
MEEIRKEIEHKLLEIEQKEQVRILHAVESGSRAWGFASPDSDYDVRFIYVRTKEDYLRLDAPRDVIEWQLDEVLDINGWDLKKALIQFHRGNASLFEWANSPIVYKTTETWGQIFRKAVEYFSVKAAVYHYYGTANSTFCQYLQADSVRYKKYFYALRPLLACRYIRAHGRPAPVLFEELLDADLPAALADGIAELMARKAGTKEGEEHPQIPVIREYIVQELANQKMWVQNAPDDRKADWMPLNRIFLDVLELNEK